MSEVTNTLSNQDFAGLDKFRLRTSLGKIKEVSVKINKIKKVKELKAVWVTFLVHLFSTVMVNLAAGNSAGKSAWLILDKRDSLESKLLRVSSEKMSCLQETVFLLNQCIGKENQGRLETDKELKILWEGLEKTNERK